MFLRFPAIILAMYLAGSIALAEDWPQWRGPSRTGVSTEKGLLKSWPKEGPKLLWTYKNAGLGFSGPAIIGKTLYTLGTRDEKEEVVIALDLDKGTELWTTRIGPVFTFKGNSWGDGPRSTPTIDGNLLFALGGQGELVCLDLAAQGMEKWRKNFIKDLGGEMMTEWGYSESPLVDGDLLICTPGGKQGTLAALDKQTGQVKWRSDDLKQKAPYSSPIVAEIQGVRQYLQNSYGDDITGGSLSGFAAKDGKVLWSMPLFKGQSYAISPTPIVQNNLVYTTSWAFGSIIGCHLYEIGPDMKAKDLYGKAAQKNVKSFHGGVVLVGEHIFGHNYKRSSWVCQDLKTGEIAWTNDQNLQCESGAIMAADGMLYLYTDEGTLALVEANPKEWKEVGRFTIPEKSKYPRDPEKYPTSRSSKVWTHPVIAHGRLYLRDHELIFCYDIHAAK